MDVVENVPYSPHGTLPQSHGSSQYCVAEKLGLAVPGAVGSQLGGGVTTAHSERNSGVSRWSW